MRENAPFRTRVLQAARELFPEIVFTPHPEAEDIILAGEHQLGLQNIRAKYSLSESPDDELREIVRAHLSLLLQGNIPLLDDFSYAEISAQLFPQIMPADFSANPELPLVSHPLGSAVCIGIVADFPKTYMYLRESDLERWDMDSQAVYDGALKNLAAASKSVPINQVGAGKDMFLAIDSCDGYDAARILVPGFQAFLATHLGEVFRFGIPNRDFLICWRVDCDPSFHWNLAGKIVSDHGERPYPLSPSVFVRNSEGNIHEQPVS